MGVGLRLPSTAAPERMGVIRTLWEGAALQSLTLQAKSGFSYAFTPTSQLTILAGSRAVLWSSEPNPRNYSRAHPMCAVWTMETSLEWAGRLGAHEFRLGGDIAYRPEQSVPVCVPDLGVTIDHVRVSASWKVRGSVSYAYYHDPGLHYTGTLSLQPDGALSVVGALGIKFER